MTDDSAHLSVQQAVLITRRLGLATLVLDATLGTLTFAPHWVAVFLRVSASAARYRQPCTPPTRYAAAAA
ncbi:hypothetical protein ASF90_11255 [Xanthomonas sp. Leaf148]|nr:hypothetical protein ASF90_11255 [Xanthomonas sp. Leaf148]